jgi:transcriptional regulator with XRE-family HTH domain
MTLNRPPAGAKRPPVDADAELLDPQADSSPTSPLEVAEQVITERARALGEFIREQRRVARLSLRKLSDMAEISNPYLSQIERGLRKPSAEILQQLARALRISAETLYVQAGILDERHENADLAKAIWDRAASEAAAASANK